MSIQKKSTLVEKQAFWAEQLPNFEAKYWLSDRAEFLVFDMEQGNYVVKDGLDPIYEDDANDTFHRVNTGWAMWKKAIVFCRDAQKVAVPNGFVLVRKELPEEIAEAMALERVEKPVTETDPAWIRISEDAYKGRLQSKKWKLWRDYKAMIEAQEQSHD